MNSHYGVLLDETSYNLGDLDLEPMLSQLEHWDRYAATEPPLRRERLERATIVVINKVRLDEALIEQLPQLRLVLITATGTDNVDLQACRERGITVCNVEDYCTASVAQHVFALILALATSLPEYMRETVSGDWTRAAHFSTLSYPILELEGKALGLIGYGTLARGVEKLARAFGMEILLAQRPGGSPRPGRLPLDELLARADIVSLHCPLVTETRHLIDSDALRKMKNSAFLINTSRGVVVDNAALAEALLEGQIAGAGIDVLEVEPPPLDHPLMRDDLPGLILTPHIAWASIEARQRVVNKVADNLAAWLRGEPINVVS